MARKGFYQLSSLVIILVSLKKLQQEKHLAFVLQPTLVNSTSIGSKCISLIQCAQSWESRLLLPMSATRCPA